MGFGFSSSPVPNKDIINLCLLKLSLVHIHKHTYKGRTREKEVRTNGVCFLKERAILYKSKLFIKAFSDLQLLGVKTAYVAKMPTYIFITALPHFFLSTFQSYRPPLILSAVLLSASGP